MEKCISVTIGRNVGAQPLPVVSWVGFQNVVRSAIAAAHLGGTGIAGPTVEAWNGSGSWGGIVEENAHFSARSPDGFNLRKLRRHLARIAADYRQEAIALSVGRSELVYARASASTKLAVVVEGKAA